jgi:hypothetical protein
MADTPTTPPPTLAEAAASAAPAHLPDNGKVSTDVPDDDGMETYGAGWAKATVDGTTYRLRRPFMGEMRDLRLALEGLTDEVTLHTERSESMRRRLQRIEARARTELQAAQSKVLAGDDDAPTEDQIAALEDRLMDEVHNTRAKDREAGRTLVQIADDNRARWWTDVFTVLGLDGVPPQWPAWFADPDGPHRMMTHWRQNPLAHG